MLANDTDADSDTLTVSAFTQPAHGAVVNNGNGTFTYTPADNNFFGQDTFTYTINDGFGGTATATVTVTVTPVNDPPVAGDDAATTQEDTPVTTDNVLANDTDVDGDTLTVSAFTQPSHGSVVDNGDGTFAYTPAAGFYGQDTFTYTVSDGHGGTAVATVTITVTRINNSPIANDDSAGTQEGTPVTTGNVLANDTDADSDTLTVSAFTQPSHGSVVNNGNGTFTYTPADNFNGQDTFT